MKNFEANPFSESLKDFRPARKSRFEGHPSELEKTPEELEIIQQASKLLEHELAELFPGSSMAEERKITAGDFVYMQDSDIRALGRNKRKELAFVDYKSKKAIINRTNLSSYGKLMSLFVTLHEGIHLKSSGFFEHETQGKIPPKIGYQINSEQDGVKLPGFNEAVVEWTTYDLIFKNKEELNRIFGFSEQDWNGLAQSCSDQIAVLNAITEKLSEIGKDSPAEVWREIKKGQFDGKLMHLRKIEKAFGKDSLKLLSAMGDEVGDAAANNNHLALIREYFCSADEKRRREITHGYFAQNPTISKAA